MAKILIFEGRHETEFPDGEHRDICIAGDCGRAREILLSDDYQVILIHLEDRDEEAVRFASFVREIPRYYLTPLLFLAKNRRYEQWASHEIHCYDYLVKPVKNQDIIKIIYPVYARLVQTEYRRQISFLVRGKAHIFNVDEIMYLTASNRNVKVYTTNGCLEVPYLRLNKFSLQYQEIFVQCHRAVVVNRDYVKCVDYTRGKVELPGVTVEMGRNYYEIMHRAFDDR